MQISCEDFREYVLRTYLWSEVLISCEVIYSTSQTKRTHKALCIFHGERNPSLTLRTESKRYQCYGCMRHGDIFDFVYHVLFGDLSAGSALKELRYLPDCVKLEREMVLKRFFMLCKWHPYL